jgi:hypothetical protein
MFTHKKEKKKKEKEKKKIVDVGPQTIKDIGLELFDCRVGQRSNPLAF